MIHLIFSIIPLSQTDSSKCCSEPYYDDCFIWKYYGENKKCLYYLWYLFPWQSSLGANFLKGSDTRFFICIKLSFSLDLTSCCSIILFFFCKLFPQNVLFTKFSQFSLHSISGTWTCPYRNRYHSLSIQLILSPLHSTLLSQTDLSKCFFGPNYDNCFIWNNYGDGQKLAFLSQKEMIPGYSNPIFFSPSWFTQFLLIHRSLL